VRWIIGILCINLLNFVASNVYEIYILTVTENDQLKVITEYWNIFTLFWFDILNLSNGIIFLYLIRSFALAQHKRSLVTSYTNRIKTLNVESGSVQPRDSRPNHGTKSILAILDRESDIATKHTNSKEKERGS
jgi:hypothetical protein